MWIPCDYKRLGAIDPSITQPAKDLLAIGNWEGIEYNRKEPPLKDGKLIALPYLIYNPVNLLYTSYQRKVVFTFEPVVNEVMKLFPNYIKVRGEIATLLPNTSLTLHYDKQRFHEYSRRIHIPITTNDRCQQIFEDRIYHLEENAVYEINNRTMHSAANFGTTARTHLILDLLEESQYNSINKSIKILSEESIPEQYRV